MDLSYNELSHFYFFRYICGLQCVVSLYVYAISLFTCDTIFILKKLKHVFLTKAH
jgi:hypothetical protein